MQARCQGVGGGGGAEECFIQSYTDAEKRRAMRVTGISLRLQQSYSTFGGKN